MAKQVAPTQESIGPVDLEAARRALTCSRPFFESTSPGYQARLEALAMLHAQFGQSKFELYWGLREPNGKIEEWSQELMQGKISQDEFASRLKSDAERPMDLGVLEAVHRAYELQIKVYARFMQTVVAMGRDSRRLVSPAVEEQEANRCIEILSGRLPLGKEHLQTAFEHLEEVRVEAGLGLSIIGEFEGGSAHWVAQLVMTRTVKAWQSCKDIAERSRTRAHYLYATTAPALFCQCWLGALPRPQCLAEHIRQEFVRARLALQGRSISRTGLQPVRLDGARPICKAMRILFLAANPRRVPPLDLEEELRCLEQGLRGVKHRDSITLIARHAVRPDDLVRYVREDRPNVIHFSGHGSKTGIILRNDLDGHAAVTGASLRRFLRDRGIDLVVLNSCYSEDQADVICGAVKVVVGTTDQVSDDAALRFSVAFYRSLGDGLPVGEALRDGADAVALQGLDDVFRGVGELGFTLVGEPEVEGSTVQDDVVEGIQRSRS